MMLPCVADESFVRQGSSFLFKRPRKDLIDGMRAPMSGTTFVKHEERERTKKKGRATRQEHHPIMRATRHLAIHVSWSFFLTTFCFELSEVLLNLRSSTSLAAGTASCALANRIGFGHLLRHCWFGS